MNIVLKDIPHLYWDIAFEHAKHFSTYYSDRPIGIWRGVGYTTTKFDKRNGEYGYTLKFWVYRTKTGTIIRMSK